MENLLMEYIVKKGELITSACFVKDEIKFEHIPENENNVGSEGIISFDYQLNSSGDGVTTPLETYRDNQKFWIKDVKLFGLNGLIDDSEMDEEKVKEYLNNLIETVLDKENL
jgi:hypothetical protein